MTVCGAGGGRRSYGVDSCRDGRGGRDDSSKGGGGGRDCSNDWDGGCSSSVD